MTVNDTIANAYNWLEARRYCNDSTKKVIGHKRKVQKKRHVNTVMASTRRHCAPSIRVYKQK